MMVQLEKPFLLFVGDVTEAQTFGKTAVGIAYWRRKDCIGQTGTISNNHQLTSLPHMTVDEAISHGAKTLVVGISPIGGSLQPDWLKFFQQALKKGLHLASGLHDKLSDHPLLNSYAKNHQRCITDVRHVTRRFPMANGRKRRGLRLLTVGTDCAVGKMFTALKIEQALRNRGIKTTFRATGQTGIFIKEYGIPFDSLPVDFASGAAEMLSPDNDDEHWDVIEGQGSILHPAASASVALLHGSQPDAMVLCHNPTRKTFCGTAYRLFPLSVYCHFYEQSARLTNPNAKIIAIACNTSQLGDRARMTYLNDVESSLGLPCIDPLMGQSVDRIIDEMEKIGGRTKN